MWIKFEGVDFNADHFKGWSQSRFIEHEKHSGLGEERLKQVYAIINGKEEEDVPREDEEYSEKD